MAACRFCDIPSTDARCRFCGVVTTPQIASGVDDNASFTDYSYNRYDESFLFKIYIAWLRFSVYLFVRNSIFSKILNIVFNPILGGRPDVSFSANERFLDVGCGRGFFLRFLPSSWLVEGCDIVDYSDKSDNIRVGNFESVAFEEKYTIVRSSHSLEHSLHPKKFLEKIIDITERGGIIVISSPNADSLSYGIFKRHWLPFNVDSHFCFLSIPVIENYLKTHGCQVIHKNTYTLFSSAGSFVELLRIKKFQTLFFGLFVVLFLPITFVEFLLNKSDSFLIYAKKI